MNSLLPDSEMTRAVDLADWQSFCLAYHDHVVRALRLLRVPEADADELAHSFLLKAEEKDFLNAFHVFQEREAAAGHRVRFRSYLYRSLQNHVRDAQRKRTTRSKECGLSPEAAGALEAAPDRALDPDAIFALSVLHQALQLLRRHCERTGKPYLWVFFEETYLADEFRGRRGKTRAELLAEYQLDDPQFLDNSLTTAKRAFRRFVQEVMPRLPGDDLEPSERFADWMETLRESRASQFNLLHLAYRVAPFLGDSSQAESLSLVVQGAPGVTSARLLYGESSLVLDDDEQSIFLSFLLEMPLSQLLDASELTPYVPATGPFHPRPQVRAVSNGARMVSPLERPLCLQTLLDPTATEVKALTAVDVVGLLVRLKSFAKQLHRRTDHSVPEIFAELIYTLVNVLAVVRYQAAIHSIGSASLSSNVRWFLEQSWLDNRVRPLFLTGLSALEDLPDRKRGT